MAQTKIIELSDDLDDEFVDCNSGEENLSDDEEQVPLKFKQSILKNKSMFEKQLLESTEIDPTEIFEYESRQENEGDNKELVSEMDLLVLDLPAGEEEEDDKLKKLAEQMNPLEGFPEVFKKMCQSGSGAFPPEDSIVTVHFNAYVQDEITNQVKSFDSTVLRGKPKSFLRGQGEVISGLDVAVGSMKKHEQSEFIFGPDMAFGLRGCPPRIPANAYVYFKIDLIDWVDSSAAEAYCKLPRIRQKQMPFMQVLEAAKSEKRKGNSLFEKQNYNMASRCYRNALSWIQDRGYANDEEEILGQKVCLKLHLDLALAALKLNKPKITCIQCRDALIIDPHNPKAFYRLGLAQEKLGDFILARKNLEKAKQICPKDSSINKALTDLNVKVRKENFIEKDLCRRMLGVSANEPSNELSATEESHKAIRRQLSEFMKNDNEDFIIFPQGLANHERIFVEAEATRLKLKFALKPSVKGESICTVFK